MSKDKIMQHTVSITSQGQLTIPVSVRQELGIMGPTKATLTQDGDNLVVKPAKDFWSLGGSLKSKVKLTDKELKAARKAFETDWAQQ